LDAEEENIIMVFPNDELGSVIYKKISPWKSGFAREEFARLQLLPWNVDMEHIIYVQDSFFNMNSMVMLFF